MVIGKENSSFELDAESGVKKQNLSPVKLDQEITLIISWLDLIVYVFRRWKIYQRIEQYSFISLMEVALMLFQNTCHIYTECKYGGPLGRRPGRVA